MHDVPFPRRDAADDAHNDDEWLQLQTGAGTHVKPTARQWEGLRSAGSCFPAPCAFLSKATRGHTHHFHLSPLRDRSVGKRVIKQHVVGPRVSCLVAKMSSM